MPKDAALGDTPHKNLAFPQKLLYTFCMKHICTNRFAVFALFACLAASTVCMVCSSCASKKNIPFDTSLAIKDEGAAPFATISAEDLVRTMGVGWNLGNTLDATASTTLASETSWGQPKTTQEMFRALSASGIKTVRLPVSWHNHFLSGTYTLDPAWMRRVKTIVDWALGEGLFVILNTHHDVAPDPALQPTSGYYPSEAAHEESLAFLKAVWAQIALAFNNGYDEHLIFELMNEPRLVGSEYEWYFNENAPECVAAANSIYEYEKAALEQVRKSGGNNSRRFVMITPYCASPDSALKEEFKIPEDPAGEGKIIISVHMYSPYEFAMQDPGVARFTGAHKNSLSATFSRLQTTFSYAGYPVIIGECGAVNKRNPEARKEWFSYFFSQAKANGFCAILWDNGVWYAEENGPFEEHFGYFNRTEGIWYFPELLAAALEATK